MGAGIAWHPDPAQTPASVQLVTASADKTARIFSGEGKQLGTLQVSSLFQPTFCMPNVSLLTSLLGIWDVTIAASRGGVCQLCYYLFALLPYPTTP